MSPSTPQQASNLIANLKNAWAFWVSSFVLLVWVAIMCIGTMRDNDGRLIYALDDAYIHTAIAKNILQHHLWGVTPYEWSSSSSSPLWTIVLSASFLIAGVRDWLPLALNIAAALGVLWVSYELLRKAGLSQRGIVGVAPALIALTPLPIVIMIGMEHTLAYSG